MATIDELLQEARKLGLSREDVIFSLIRVIEHNERYRCKRRQQAKKTRYDILLAETQPALALAWVMLQEQKEESNDVEEAR